jgi:hypothetical protein
VRADAPELLRAQPCGERALKALGALREARSKLGQRETRGRAPEHRRDLLEEMDRLDRVGGSALRRRRGGDLRRRQSLAHVRRGVEEPRRGEGGTCAKNGCHLCAMSDGGRIDHGFGSFATPLGEVASARLHPTR